VPVPPHAAYIERAHVACGSVGGTACFVLARRPVGDVLYAAVIRLNARKAQRALRCDPIDECEQRILARHAAAMLPGIDFRQHVYRHTCTRRRVAERMHLRQRIHANRKAHVRCQLDGHGQLVHADELVAHMNARDARRRERIGLRQLLAAHADRARFDLTPRDLAGLVRLRMRTQRDAVPRHERRHCREIGVEGIEVDRQRRRGNGYERVAHAGGGRR
jgi:hypothetical protein